METIVLEDLAGTLKLIQEHSSEAFYQRDRRNRLGRRGIHDHRESRTVQRQRSNEGFSRQIPVSMRTVLDRIKFSAICVSVSEVQLMEISEQHLCLFSEQIKQRDGSYVIEIPERELEIGNLDEGAMYRVAVLQSTDLKTSADRGSNQDRDLSDPPVEEGETRVVEIEDIGEQGDGIARVERGYVVIVSGAGQGERVEVEIVNARENVAFAEVVERLEYYE